ncbi:hypothetical protein [Amycolatopsis minnesotensis]|uniref:PE family protein n=1 Tax=Amycolatopsis minnesotensis TaxID=337894 RepID=A0ABP5DQ40_9PSEU
MNDPANVQSPGTMGAFRWMGDADIRIADAAIADADATASSAGRSGFTLDLDQAHQLLADATRIRQELTLLQDNASVLERLEPPAQDPASKGYNGLLTRQGEQPGAFAYGAGHLRVEVEYLTELIGRLQKALVLKEGTEHDHGRKLKKTDDGQGYAG